MPELKERYRIRDTQNLHITDGGDLEVSMLIEGQPQPLVLAFDRKVADSFTAEMSRHIGNWEGESK